MSADPPTFTRMGALKSPTAFREHAAGLGVDIPCDEPLMTGAASPLLQPVAGLTFNGRTIGNRVAIHPMEGWDGTLTGGVTDDVRRRWQRFGESGAKLICGGEAMAVRPDGRANPHQLILCEENQEDLASLVALCRATHRSHWGDDSDLVIGFQLTHSGRFCRPSGSAWASKVAFRHPLLDPKFNVTRDDQVLSDEDMDELVDAYIRAARIAKQAGADFVDIKHCHGYLLHEFLGAHQRPGRYGGSFENRTRPLRAIMAGLQAGPDPIEAAVRLSLFDLVPHRPDPSRSRPRHSRRIFPPSAVSLRRRYRCRRSAADRSHGNPPLHRPLRRSRHPPHQRHRRLAVLYAPHPAARRRSSQRWISTGS